MKLLQLVHTLNYGDAISGEAITMKRLAAEAGFDSQILSVHAHDRVMSETTLLRNYRATKNDQPTLMLLHYSIASPLNDLYLDSSSEFRASIYHNLTPERFYLGYNARVVKDLRRASEDLKKVLHGSDVVIADSNYNAQELHRFGATSVSVLPLLIDSAKWGIPANAGIAGILRGHGGPNFLHVGRTAPNKSVEDIIKAFYFYHHKIDRTAKLWLIGSDIDNEIYSFELRRLIAELQLRDAVNFVGAVADCELRAFYENSTAYLAMSEHEGFCVPLIEAMHFGLPVIAFGSTAVADTVGNGGIILQRKAPAETAELLHLLVTDTALRSSLQERGRARASEFGLQQFLPKFEATVLEPYRHALRSRASQVRHG